MVVGITSSVCCLVLSVEAGGPGNNRAQAGQLSNWSGECALSERVEREKSLGVKAKLLQLQPFAVPEIRTEKPLVVPSLANAAQNYLGFDFKWKFHNAADDAMTAARILGHVIDRDRK